MTDPIVAAARFLTSQLEWTRHATDEQGGPYAEGVLAEIADCAARIRHVVDGPSAKRFLGPCGAPLVAITPDVAAEYDIAPANAALGLAPCDGDVYAREGASSGACRVCGAKWSTAERAVWLDGVARSWLFTAREIADAYPINVKTIRSWYDRGLLATHGDYDGRPLLKLGEVLDLAAGDAARREEARATRARRKEQAA